MKCTLCSLANHYLRCRAEKEQDHGAAGDRRADDDAAFHAYAEQFPALVLKQGDVIIMGNLSAHKVSGIRGVGASVLYLPPYSPDLNPIEQLFAKIKAILLTLAARSRDTHWNAIRLALERCDDVEFEAYLRSCGYGST